MSALTQDIERAGRGGRASESARVAARSRRSDAGNVTEMARALLRDAREAGAYEPSVRRGGAVPPSRLIRRGARLA
jgi:hypothetical protein